MVHLLMLIVSIGLALVLRLYWGYRYSTAASWSVRWCRSLMAFALPPLLLLSTAIALLWMGPICHMAHYQMIHGWQGTLTYSWAAAYLVAVVICGLWLGVNGCQAVWQLQRYDQVALAAVSASQSVSRLNCSAAGQKTARLVPVTLPYIAQIGLWRPELIVSQGLIDQLDAQHLEAVLSHEAAHRYYGDTIWFAVLGVLRRCSRWLPYTKRLWQELLLLRELRADRWAAQHVDPLLLAEALFTVVSAPMSMEFAAAFNEPSVGDRLNERVDALLQENPTEMKDGRSWMPLGLMIALALVPLWTLVLHH